EKRRDLSRTTIEQVRVLALDDVEAADSRADVHTNAFRDLGSDVQTRHLHRFVRGAHTEMNEAAHLAGFFFLDEIQRIEVLDFGGDSAGKPGGIKTGNRCDAAFAREEIGPGLRARVSHRAN